MKESTRSSLGQRLRATLREYLFEDVRIKLLALLIVLVIWFSVAGQSRPAAPIQIRNLDITLDHTPPGFAITGSEPQQASIKVKGPEDLLRELRFTSATQTSDLTVFGDLSNISEGISNVRLKLGGLPEGVELQSIEPESVRVTLEPIRTAEVPIEPRFAGTVPDGYKITEAYAKPPTVTLRGPESLLSKFEKLTTTTVNLNGRTAPFDEVVDVDMTETGVFVQDRVEVYVNVEEDQGSQTFTVPVTVAGAQAGVMEPPSVTVTLAGPRPALKQISASDITAMITPEGAAAHQSLTLRVTVSGAAAARVTVERVQPQAVRWRK